MTTSSANNSVFRGFFEKQKLNGPNFIDCYRQLRIVLSIEDKLNYLDQPIPPALVAPEERKLLQTMRESHSCKQKEGQSVSSYVLKMKSYIDNLERLGHPVTLGLETINELHAMLKLHEQTLPKNNAPALHAIRAGKVQKGNKKHKPQPQLDARGQNQRKGKNKLAYAPKPKIPPPPKREDPAKESVCHQEFSIYALRNKRAKSNLDSTLLWHCRLGHISKKRIEKLQHDRLLNSTDLRAFEKCNPYMSVKMERKPYSHQVKRAKDLLGLIHTDVFQKEVENQLGKTIKSLCSDRGVWGCEELVKRDTLTKPDKLEPRSTRTRHAPDRMCLYIDDEEHEFGDLAIATFYDYEIWQMNVKNSFLNGYLSEEVYMEQPEGFVNPKYLNRVCKLKRSIYGLKQASRCFTIKDLGEAAYILGIKIYRDRLRWLIGLCQSAYIEKILKRYYIENSKRGSIPMQDKLRLSKSQGASTPAELKRMQNVSYASANPCDLHWTTVKNILKYLRNTKDMFLVYGDDIKQVLWISCYTDAGYLTDADDLKSQTGYVFVLNGGITKGARHFHAKVHYLRKVIEYGDVKLEKVHTYDNLADPFTKALVFLKHSEHTKSIGMLPASSLMTHQDQVDKMKEFLSSNFSIKDMGEADIILGIKIKREDEVSTALDPTIKLIANIGTAVDQLEYSRAIGWLMYAMTRTRSYIVYDVGKLSAYTSNPSTHHMHVVMRVFKYLKKTMDYGLSYVGFPSVLEGYSDASWITNLEDHTSTTGWVFLLGGGVISWASKKQTYITDSTMEAEFIALGPAGKEGEWPPRVTFGRLLPHARGLGFKPRRGGFPSGAKKKWGLSLKAKEMAGGERRVLAGRVVKGTVGKGGLCQLGIEGKRTWGGRGVIWYYSDVGAYTGEGWGRGGAFGGKHSLGYC
nr:zinc finger, CCHC-type [Tanacetum cinerariifolium]